MAWFTGIFRVRFLMLLAALALVFTTACWASVFKDSYGDPGTYGNKIDEGKTARASGFTPRSSVGKAGQVTPYDGQQGLHVRATGAVTGTPDIAIISLGVESIEDTASEARAMAAGAMAGVMVVLEEAGIGSRDIQTQYFNIRPRYKDVRITNCGDEEEKEIGTAASTEDCTTSWELRLIGYSVSNQATVKIRNLGEAGTIIDQVTEAAGDLVRVNNVSFTIEDTDALKEEARDKAVEALQRKALAMAELAGVSLGRLVQLEEATDFFDAQPVYARTALHSAESAADTSISAGEIQVSATVSGVYLITPPDGE